MRRWILGLGLLWAFALTAYAQRPPRLVVSVRINVDPDRDFALAPFFQAAGAPIDSSATRIVRNGVQGVATPIISGSAALVRYRLNPTAVSGIDTLTLETCTKNPGSVCFLDTILVLVQPAVNRPPVANNRRYSVEEYGDTVWVPFDSLLVDPDNNLRPEAFVIRTRQFLVTLGLVRSRRMLWFVPPADRDGFDTLDVGASDFGAPVLSASASVFIEVIPYGRDRDIDLFIPEGISPNGDGINEIFELGNKGRVKISLRVYNRWGSVVYTDPDYLNNWGGTINQGTAVAETRLAEGTYIVQLERHDGRQKWLRKLAIKRY